MRVSKYCQMLSSFNASTSSLVHSSAPSSSANSPRARTQPESASPSVINRIDLAVYNAVDDFLYLPGKDITDSYGKLSDDGKSRFMSIVKRIASDSPLSQERLGLLKSLPAPKESPVMDYSFVSNSLASEKIGKG